MENCLWKLAGNLMKIWAIIKIMIKSTSLFQQYCNSLFFVLIEIMARPNCELDRNLYRCMIYWSNCWIILYLMESCLMHGVSLFFMLYTRFSNQPCLTTGVWVPSSPVRVPFELSFTSWNPVSWGRFFVFHAVYSIFQLGMFDYMGLSP